MNALVCAMIYACSALMAYNIVHCYAHVKCMRKVSGLETSRAILPIPLILLVCFLIGYLAVALFGTPDFIIVGIMFGGSVFVFCSRCQGRGATVEERVAFILEVLRQRYNSGLSR